MYYNVNVVTEDDVLNLYYSNFDEAIYKAKFYEHMGDTLEVRIYKMEMIHEYMK